MLGHFNAGFSPQDFTASLVLQADPTACASSRPTRVENACATGSAAVHQAVHAIEAGGAQIVLVVGVEQMTRTPGPRSARTCCAPPICRRMATPPAASPACSARSRRRYFQRHGDQSDALAMIAAKNHRNGVDNPYAQMRKDLGFDFCRDESEKNPFVAGPLKRTDCSLVSDGAAALVIADARDRQTMRKAVASAPPPTRRISCRCRSATSWSSRAARWPGSRRSTGRRPLDDLSFVETHDCFTIAELIEYEAMGLTPRGQGARAIKEGWTQKDGKLPVNPSGGLKAKGHPIGATGVSMHVLSAMQLVGEAPEGMQVENARLAGIFNMGGAAVANYVSVLEPAK